MAIIHNLLWFHQSGLYHYQALSRHFRTYDLQIVGSVALFAAWA